MKINMKRILALVMALLLVLSFAACKNGNNDKDSETTTAATEETVAAGADETKAPSESQDTTSMDSSEPESNSEATTEDSTNTTEKPTSNSGTTSTQKGLNSTDIKKVVEFYKAAAKKTGTIDAKQTMSLASLDCIPRNKAEEYFLEAFEPIARAALKANSSERTDVPGNHQALESSDITSANAVVSGNYTIVTLNVKTQEDNQYTKDSGIGPVGHAIGTLGDVTLALNEIPAVKVDYSNGSIVITYTNAKVVAKIDNNTGKIVSGTWAYTANAMIKKVLVTFLGFDIDVARMGGAVDFVVKTND